jgi:hypothetical protein
MTAMCAWMLNELDAPIVVTQKIAPSSWELQTAENFADRNCFEGAEEEFSFGGF